jgi:hypothetical protein
MLVLLLTHRRVPFTEASRSGSPVDALSPDGGAVSSQATPDAEQPLRARLIASAKAVSAAVLIRDGRVISHSLALELN